VPIIENVPREEELKLSMAEAMKQYPDAAAADTASTYGVWHSITEREHRVCI
jgi:hypothetical protein